MRSLLTPAIVLVACSFAFAQAADPAKQRLENSPRHHEWVDVKTDKGRTVRSFVVFPERREKAAAVIVIHENRGLTDWVRSVADQLAEAGYIAIGPDLLSGTGPGGGNTDAFRSSDDARAGIYKLPPEQVLSDLDAVHAYVKRLDAANGKVAVAGFCWGGAKSFAYAAHNPGLAAAFVFYGTAVEDAAEMKKIKAPVYGFYGGNDARITAAAPKVEQQMKQAGKAYEPVVYEGAGHGFMRSGEELGADAANQRAMQAAWKRWKDLLAKL